jgi:hypothetical protein
MNTPDTTSRMLGVAFLFQFVTSLSSAVLKQAWFVPGSISDTMLKIANSSLLMRTNILIDMLTALGVIFLGAMLFITLRRQNEKLALTAFGFYILEAVLLANSRMEAFSLLRISQDYVSAGQPAHLLAMGNVAYEAMDFVGFTLHVLTFCIGGVIFYYLLYKSSVVPRLLSLWGLITIVPLLIAAVSHVLGHELPFFLVLPYVPFELAIAIWIMVKGIDVSPAEE